MSGQKKRQPRRAYALPPVAVEVQVGAVGPRLSAKAREELPKNILQDLLATGLGCKILQHIVIVCIHIYIYICTQACVCVCAYMYVVYIYAYM